jgi:hypothetical protein
VDWLLAGLRHEGVPVSCLEDLPQLLDGPRARALARKLTRASAAPGPRALVEQTVRALLPEIAPERLWLQTFAHVRILLPGDHAAAFPPHCDFGLGHGLHERNLWLSLSEARGDGALHALPLLDSLALLHRTPEVRGIFHGPVVIPPVPTDAGEALLFTPLHLHRASPPTGGCRVSMDLRILPRGTVAPDLTFTPLHPGRTPAVP